MQPFLLLNVSYQTPFLNGRSARRNEHNHFGLKSILYASSKEETVRLHYSRNFRQARRKTMQIRKRSGKKLNRISLPSSCRLLVGRLLRKVALGTGLFTYVCVCPNTISTSFPSISPPPPASKGDTGDERLHISLLIRIARFFVVAHFANHTIKKEKINSKSHCPKDKKEAGSQTRVFTKPPKE